MNYFKFIGNDVLLEICKFLDIISWFRILQTCKLFNNLLDFKESWKKWEYILICRDIIIPKNISELSMCGKYHSYTKAGKFAAIYEISYKSDGISNIDFIDETKQHYEGTIFERGKNDAFELEIRDRKTFKKVYRLDRNNVHRTFNFVWFQEDNIMKLRNRRDQIITKTLSKEFHELLKFNGIIYINFFSITKNILLCDQTKMVIIREPLKLFQMNHEKRLLESDELNYSEEWDPLIYSFHDIKLISENYLLGVCYGIQKEDDNYNLVKIYEDSNEIIKIKKCEWKNNNLEKEKFRQILFLDLYSNSSCYFCNDDICIKYHNKNFTFCSLLNGTIMNDLHNMPSCMRGEDPFKEFIIFKTLKESFTINQFILNPNFIQHQEKEFEIECPYQRQRFFVLYGQYNFLGSTNDELILYTINFEKWELKKTWKMQLKKELILDAYVSDRGFVIEKKCQKDHDHENYCENNLLILDFLPFNLMINQ